MCMLAAIGIEQIKFIQIATFSTFYIIKKRIVFRIKLKMTTRTQTIIYEAKPGARYTILRDLQRKERELKKYLNQCGLQKRVNPETYAKRSQLIEQMYEQKKVMKNRMCRRKGAQEYNFKKQSAARIISQNKITNGAKFESISKAINKRQIDSLHLDFLSDDE